MPVWTVAPCPAQVRGVKSHRFSSPGVAANTFCCRNRCLEHCVGSMLYRPPKLSCVPLKSPQELAYTNLLFCNPQDEAALGPCVG